MRRRRSIPDKVLDGLIETLEETFRLGQVSRSGYLIRGVEEPLKMDGHIGMLGRFCLLAHIELELELDLLKILEMCAIHDNEKTENDPPRFDILPDNPSSGAFLRGLKARINRGKPRKDREEDLRQALEKMGPHWRNSPKAWAKAQKVLTEYLLRLTPEAAFVEDMGAVMDVHIALWCAHKGKMEPTPRNIRTFTEFLSLRIHDWVAKAFWGRLKSRYIQYLEKAYGGSKKRALAQ